MLKYNLFNPTRAHKVDTITTNLKWLLKTIGLKNTNTATRT